MDRLSGLDASFLYLETPEQLMHVCGLILLDPTTVPGGYSFDRLREQLGERAAEIPTFTRKLRRVPLGLDFPVWERDEHFDVQRHVHRMAVPAPGGDEELAEIVGHLAGLLLDRSRPLWEMWVIEGLASGQIAVVTKMHHATVDGVSGANLMSMLCSLEPDAPLLDLDPSEEGEGPGDVDLLARLSVDRERLAAVIPRLVELARLECQLPEEEEPLADRDRELLPPGEGHALVEEALGRPEVATPEGHLAQRVQGDRLTTVVADLPAPLETGLEGGGRLLDLAGLQAHEPEGLERAEVPGLVAGRPVEGGALPGALGRPLVVRGGRRHERCSQKRLGAGRPHHVGVGVLARAARLVGPARLDPERDPEPLEDLAPPGRRRGEHERRAELAHSFPCSSRKRLKRRT